MPSGACVPTVLTRIVGRWFQCQAYEKAATGRAIAASVRRWRAEGLERLDYEFTSFEARARDDPMFGAETNPEIAARPGLDSLTARLTAELVEAFHAAEQIRTLLCQGRRDFSGWGLGRLTPFVVPKRNDQI